MQEPQKTPRLGFVGAAAACAALALGGCLSVRVDQQKPIEINLNVNIKQEVIVRLEGDAKDLLKKNADIF